MGNLNIVVPQGTTVVVNTSGGVSDVNTNGDWAHSGDTYSTSGSGPTITIDLEMGVGSATLTQK